MAEINVPLPNQRRAIVRLEPDHHGAVTQGSDDRAHQYLDEKNALALFGLKEGFETFLEADDATRDQIIVSEENQVSNWQGCVETVSIGFIVMTTNPMYSGPGHLGHQQHHHYQCSRPGERRQDRMGR